MPKLPLTIIFFLLQLGSIFAEQWAPDFLLIGAQKSGTTALYQFINTHPLVVKKDHEVHFFDIFFDRWIVWYENQFPPRPDPRYVVGDKSPCYLLHPLAAQRAHALYPDVKIIIILRNPIDRAYSSYQMVKRWKVETLSFEAAIEAEPERLVGEKEKMLADPSYHSDMRQTYSYLTRGHYAEQIKQWQAYFPPQQILILTHDDLSSDPVAVMNQVFAFLGLPPHYDASWFDNEVTDYASMHPSTRAALVEYYRPYNHELEVLLDRKFNWD